MDPRANAATAWSPVKDLGNLFALGTTSSELHLVSLDFSAVDAAPHVVGLVPTPAPFRTLAWSPATKHAAAHPWGLVAGGLEDGTVSIWDPTQISTGHIDALSTVSKHKGAVTALQFNPNKDSTHLLASGGADGDVWIMSVNNVAAPGVFSPGTALASTSAPSEITCVSWNTTAPYILATGDSSGHVTVWDLKQKKPCFNVSVYGAISSLAWSPHEGFLLLTATRQSPLVHIWDLRASNSVPLVELHGHHGGGIVSAAWCPHGSGLLVTSGTDGRTLVWDLQTRQVIHEVPTSEPAAHLTFSPQYPGLVAFTTVNEHAVHVLQATAGATYPILKWTPPIIPSPVADDTTTEPRALQLSPELSSFSSTEVVPSPSKSSVEPPVLHDDVAAAASVAASPARSMHPLPVTSSSASPSSPEPVDALVFAVHQLDELTPDAFCDWKLTTLTSIDDDQARHTWSFLKVLFEPDARKQLLVHLGFDGAAVPPSAVLPSPSDVESGPLPTFTAASEASITRSLLVGNFDAAVDVCLANNQLANALLLATCGGPELWHRTQEAFFSRQTRPFMQIVAAIIKNELDTLVLQSDPVEWKQTLAILSTYSKSDEFPALCDQLAWRLLKSGDAFAASLCFICAMNMPKTVELWTAAASSHGHPAATVHLVEQIHVLAQGTGQSPDLDAPVYEAFAALLYSWDQPVLARKFSKHDTTTGTRGGSTSITTSSSSTAKKDATSASFRSSPPKPIKLAPLDTHFDLHDNIALSESPVSQPAPSPPLQNSHVKADNEPRSVSDHPSLSACPQHQQATPSSNLHPPSLDQYQLDATAPSHRPVEPTDDGIPSTNTFIADTSTPLTPVSQILQHDAPRPSTTSSSHSADSVDRPPPFVRTAAMANISEDDLGIVETLTALLSLLSFQKLSGAEAKQLAEAVKAKDALVAKLNAADLSPTVLDSVHDMAAALQRRDFKAAQQVHVALTSSHWALQKEWLRGLKPFYQLCIKRLK